MNHRRGEPETAQLIHIDVLEDFFLAFVEKQGLSKNDERKFVGIWIEHLQKMERFKYGEDNEDI